MSTIRFSLIPEDSESKTWKLYGEKETGSLLSGIGDDDLDLGSVHQRRAITVDEKKLDAHFADFKKKNGFGDAAKPVVCFVHGFQFDPRIEPTTKNGKSSNPHTQLYRFSETALPNNTPGIPGSDEEHDTHSTPWLRRASDKADANEFPGLAVAFGYESWGNELNDPTPSTVDFWRALANVDWQQGRFRNIYAQAYLDAEYAGAALAGVIVLLDKALGDDPRPIDLFAHSLGTRTVLLALQRLALHYQKSRALDRVGNVLLLAGAATWTLGAQALLDIQNCESERKPSFFNFPSSEDAVISLLGSRAALRAAADSTGMSFSGAASFFRFIKGGELIGREGRPHPSILGITDSPYEDWVDIQLDHSGTERWAKRRYRIDLKGNRKGFFELLDHWIHYTHPGNWELYRAILYDRANWTTSKIKSELARYTS